MESVSKEQSYNGNYSELSVPMEFLVAYYSLLAVINIPVIFLNVLIILALLVDRTTVGVIRLVLCNISVACLLVAVILLMFDIAGIIVPFTDIGSPERVIELCRITSFVVTVGGAARFLCLLGSSVYYNDTSHAKQQGIEPACFHWICHHNHISVVIGYPEWLACSV